MRRVTIPLAVVALAILEVPSAFPAFAQNAPPAEGDRRNPLALPFDARATEGVWLDVAAGARIWSEGSTTPKANDLYLDAALAFHVVSRLEVGVSGSFVSRDFDRSELGSTSGVGDTTGWAKFQFPSAGSATLSVGGFASFPTGREKSYLGTGNLDGGLYAAGGVRTAGNGFVQAYLGFRTNGEPKTQGPAPPGKTSLLVGFSGFIEAATGIEAFGAFDLETERYDGADAYYALSGGARWRLSPSWRLEARAIAGLSDAAPRVSLAFGAVFAK